MVGGPVRRLRMRVAAMALWACVLPAWALPTYDEVLRDFQPSDTLILSREGEVLDRKSVV